MIIITIDDKFGSEFQYKAGIDALLVILTAWKDFWNRNHKKTKIEYTIEKYEK